MRLERTIAISIPSMLLTLALAQSSTGQAQAEEISIGVFPTITEITVQPGETLETEVQVKNNDESTVTLTTLLQPFTASGQEDGAVRYFDEAPELFRSIQIFDARERVNEIVMAPNEVKTLTMRIHIPERTESRDYYYSLVLLSKPVPGASDLPQEGIRAYAQISGGVATHFLVSVNPQSASELKVAELSAPPLSQQTPIPFTLRVSNLSPNFTKVSGDIAVQNVFGATQKISIPETTILAQSTRAISDPEHGPAKPVSRKEVLLTRSQPDSGSLQQHLWQTQPLFPGIYRAQLSLKNSTDQRIMHETVYFAVAPVQLIFLLCIILIVGYIIKRRIQKKYR